MEKENNISKDINDLNNMKLDRILFENISTTELNKLDTSAETDTVKLLHATIIDLINKLKAK